MNKHKHEQIKPQELTRRQREDARHRQEILDVALGLFSDKGFHNVSVKEISQKAEFGLGTIYKFFGNKEGLYHSMVMERATECHAILKSALIEHSSAIKCLEEFIKGKIAFFQGNKAFIRLYLFETQGVKFSIRAGLEENIRKLHDDILGDLTGLFSRGIKDGVFKTDLPPRLLAVAFDGMSTAVLVEWLETGQEEPLSAKILLNLFLGPVLVPGAIES